MTMMPATGTGKRGLLRPAQRSRVRFRRANADVALIDR
jgi:hypothetical protein